MRRSCYLTAKRGVSLQGCLTASSFAKGWTNESNYCSSSNQTRMTKSKDQTQRVSVLAFFKVKAEVHQEGKESPIIAATKEMIFETQKEPGCIKYDLHRDLSDPLRFVMIEEWESMSHLETHLKSSHVAAGRLRLKDILEVPTDIRKYVHATSEQVK